MNSRLDSYLEGWKKGDPGMILGSLADDFVYDDPKDGLFTRDEFAAHLVEVFGESASDIDADEGFETITDVVRQEKDGEVTLWGWWKTPTEEGAGLVKAGPEGVHSEKLAYHTRSDR